MTMGMTRVWNITDDPTTKVQERLVVVCGKAVMPGRFVNVDEDILKNAHKLKAEVQQGLVFIGKNPPAKYAAWKKPLKAQLPKGMARAHGEQKKSAD
jgi:hypothetical protein